MDSTGQIPCDRYAKCIEVSKRIRWDIEKDVIRGRDFDYSHKFLPDSLSLADQVTSLSLDERRLMSHVQGRTYANMFGLVERFISAKILEISRDHWLGDQTALEALIRFTDEELKHQALFRKIEAMMAERMPAGYYFVPEPNSVARDLLGAATWAVLALTCHIELFTQAHYRASIDAAQDISPLWKDVFLYHWKEESQHAILDELEWLREDARLSESERDKSVDDFIGLLASLDGLLQIQSVSDSAYFRSIAGRNFSEDESAKITGSFLRAYRYQYIVSGVLDKRFNLILRGLVSGQQSSRIEDSLKDLVAAVHC